MGPFPDGLRGVGALSGESIAALGFYIADDVHTCLSALGELDFLRRRKLADHATDLAAVFPTVTGPDAAYVVVLLYVAELIAHEQTGPDQPGLP
ncbi:hypothetical protein ACQPYK_22685 [Streptosporangium sp. CA-135522]|uniref:hypothetical protein n=1 Tax=Streptosporangium sp. CA-135522 TaxID=3240072 RepID=UPI003D8E76DF